MKLGFKVVLVSFSATKRCGRSRRVHWSPAPYQVSPVNQSHHLYLKHGRYVWELSAGNSAASSAANSAASSAANLAASSAANSAASSAANWLTVDCSSSSVCWMYFYLYSSRGGFMLILASQFHDF